VVIFGAAIGASAGTQTWLRHGLAQQLDALGRIRPGASASQDLSTLQSQNRAGGPRGEPVHVPRKSLAADAAPAEAVRPLPDTIRLTKISVIEEEQAKIADPVGPRTPRREKPGQASPPEKDLTKLRKKTSGGKPR